MKSPSRSHSAGNGNDASIRNVATMSPARNEDVVSMNDSINDEPSPSPNQSSHKWSLLSLRGLHHSASADSPSNSFRRRRLFKMGDYASQLASVTKATPVKTKALFSPSSNSWAGSAGRNATLANSADEIANLTIDDALRSLYDESNCFVADKNTCLSMQDRVLWWTLDDYCCYDKRDRDSKKVTVENTENPLVMNSAGGESSIEEKTLTFQLFEELHADPLITLVDRFITINDVLCENDENDVDSAIRDPVELEDDFGEFQSAASVDAFSEDDNTRSEPVETSNPLVVLPHDDNIISNVKVTEENTLKSVVRSLSFDDCDNDAALLQYIDPLRGSPMESPSISASLSLDTPDLIRMADEVIKMSYDNGTVDVESGSEVKTVLTVKHECEVSRGAASPRLSENTLNDDRSSKLGNGNPTAEQCITISSVDKDVDALLLPLSMILPVGNDLSTLEARFTRRMQQQNDLLGLPHVDPPSTLKTSNSDLPPYYFTNSDIDDTISVLQSLPWQHMPLTSGHNISLGGNSVSSINFQDSAESWALWDEHTTARLCQLDTSLQQIQSDTLLHIQPYQPTLFRANALLHEWDQNLRLAFMYWERSKNSLSSIMGSEGDTEGVKGIVFLYHSWQQQKDYQFLDSLLDELSDILNRESDLVQQIDRFDVKDFNALETYFKVLERAKVLEDRVSNGRLARLCCLQDLRERLQSIGVRFWKRLLEITRSFVVHSCRKSSELDWDEYERLFRAFLDLKSHEVASLSDAIDNHTSWTDNVSNAFAYEIDASFALALLYPSDCKNSFHEHDLKDYSNTFDACWGDYSTLRLITHNLVNIRFDLEWEMNHLPCIIRQLCKRLFDILYAYYSFVQWHRDSYPIQMTNGSGFKKMSSVNLLQRTELDFIQKSLSGFSPKIWEHCESIVAKCLDEYLNFSPKRTLFQRCGEGVDDSLWQEDLNHLHSVYVCVDCFRSFKISFLGYKDDSLDKNSSPTDPHSMISDKLTKVFCRHLRLLHVEAMNTVGRCLANESWILGSFAAPHSQDVAEQIDHPKLSIQSILTLSLVSASSHFRQSSSINRYHFVGFENKYSGNPFESRTYLIDTEQLHIYDDSEHGDSVVDQKLFHLIIDQDPRLAPIAVTKELIFWLARLLHVMERLPLIAGNAADVLINLFDLYFTTVFRLCSGNSKSDRLLLGEDLPNPISFPNDDQCFSNGSSEKTNGTPMFGSFRSSQQKSVLTRRKSGNEGAFTVCLDAEICSPLPQDVPNARILQSFIRRAQTSLRNVVNLDMVDSWLKDPHSDSPEEQGCEVARVLIKRQGAIWSCFTLAALVKLVADVAEHKVSSSSPHENFPESKLFAIHEYCKTVCDVIPTLVRVASHIACTRAIEGSNVVKEVLKIGAGWEECKLHEIPNGYVDDLCLRCSLVWGYLCASNKLPIVIMEETWEGIVSAAYFSLLEGYSRVQRCSTEGRARMTLDLASFRAGISPRSIIERVESLVDVRRPPTIDPEIGNRYVETYIKVFYYPKNDVIEWIKEHCNQYKMNHVLSLVVTTTLSCTDRGSEIQAISLLDDVRALYQVNDV